MKKGPLRLIRLTSLLLIVALSGYYAGNFFLQERKIKTGAISSSTVPQVTPDSELAMLPDFTLMDVGGNPRSISEWSKQPLLINFWATWCAPCRREMPLLQKLHEERQNTSFQVIGVAIDRLDDVQAYVIESGVTYPILVGELEAMEVAEKFGSGFVGLPFSVFTAPNGQVLTVRNGELQRDELRAILAITDQVTSGQLSTAEARQQFAER